MRVVVRVLVLVLGCILSCIIWSKLGRAGEGGGGKVKDTQFLPYHPADTHIRQGRVERGQCAEGIAELVQSFTIPRINSKSISDTYKPDIMSLIQVVNGTVYSSPPPPTEMVFERDRRAAFLWMLNGLLPSLSRGNDFELLLSVKDCCAPSETPIFAVTRCAGTNQLPYVQWNQIRDGPLPSWNRRVRRARERVQKCPWKERSGTVVFRGSLSRRFSFNQSGHPQPTTVDGTNWRKVGRSILAHLANETSGEQLFDVKLRHVKDILPDYPFDEAIEETSMEQQACTHKYTAIVEGNCGWADRFKSFLAMGTLCFVQETPCKEYYSLLATAGRHYLPVTGSLSNLTEAIRWARANDAKGKQIADNGVKFCDKYLTESSMLCYMRTLVSAYQARFEGAVSRRSAGR